MTKTIGFTLPNGVEITPGTRILSRVEVTMGEDVIFEPGEVRTVSTINRNVPVDDDIGPRQWLHASFAEKGEGPVGLIKFDTVAEYITSGEWIIVKLEER